MNLLYNLIKKFLFIILFIYFSSAQEAQINSKILVTCARCHGVDGNATITTETPKLAGQNSQYLIRRLHYFRSLKSSSQKNQIMILFARDLSEQAIRAIANYYASLPRRIDIAQPDHINLAQKLYLGGQFTRGIPACAACHGPRGLGNPLAGFPRLSGQHADYHYTQLQAFHSNKKRIDDKNAMMQEVTAKLTDLEMAALANYISGLY